MKTLPPVERIQLFITNRRKWGWPDELIASELRKRLTWNELDVVAMDECGKARYGELRDVLWALSELRG